MSLKNVQSWLAATVALVVVGSAPAAKAEEGLLDFSLQEDEPAIAAVPEKVESIPKPDADSKPGAVPQEAASVGDRSLEVSFELAAVEESVASSSVTASQVPVAAISTVPDALAPSAGTSHGAQSHPQLQVSAKGFFEGGSNSLVAKAVGSAEGTRTPEGGKTRAYYGHVDPGNGVWNVGSFSYQHGAKTPEEADEKQLRRLQRQAQELRHQATQKGITMTLEEELNGIDLANQSPAAALDRGYIPWLTTARNMGLAGSDAVLWARTRSYLDPDSGRWSAPGLGNTLDSITHDQERRMKAVNRAIALHQQHLLANGAIDSATDSATEAIANQVIFQDVLEE